VTDSLIEQARQVHRLLGDLLRPLTERELVESMLMFANDDTDENIIRAAHVVGSGFLSGTYTPPKFEKKLLAFRASKPGVVKPAHQWWRGIARERERWREALQTIIKGTKAERERLGEWASKARGALVLIPRLTGRATTPETLYVTDSLEAAFAHTALLLLDRKALKKLGGRVRQCELDGCHNFLLSAAAAGGGPRMRFCSQEHKKVFLRLGNRERQERKRGKDRRSGGKAKVRIS